jgi:MFS family permease
VVRRRLPKQSGRPTEDERALKRWRNSIITAFALGGIAVSTWGPRLPAIRSELRIATGTIGLVLACATVGSIGGLLAARPMLHRLGGRRAVFASLLVVAAALTVMAGGIALRSIPLLATGFIVVGFGLTSLDVGINVEGAAIEREARRTLLPIMHAAWSGGVAIGSAIGAACAAIGIRPAVQLAALAVVIGLAGLILTRCIPVATPDEAALPQREAWATRIRTWLRGWTDFRLLAIGLVLLGVEFGEGAANSWLSLAVHQNHGQSGAIAALSLTLFAVCEMATRTVSGPLVDRFGRVAAIRFTTMLGVAGLALFIFTDAAWTIAVGIALWAIGVSMGFPLGMSAAAEAGDDPAAQVSVAASLAYFSGLLGPPLVGYLAESVGLLGALWSVPVLLLAAFASAKALRPVARTPVALVDHA